MKSKEGRAPPTCLGAGLQADDGNRARQNCVLLSPVAGLTGPTAGVTIAWIVVESHRPVVSCCTLNTFYTPNDRGGAVDPETNRLPLPRNETSSQPLSASALRGLAASYCLQHRITCHSLAYCMTDCMHVLSYLVLQI